MRVADKLTDLDFAILATLPVEGSTLGPHTFAKQVISITEEIDGVTSPQVNGRVRSLKFLGLVTNVVVQPVAGGAGWQITQAGQKVLSERRGHSGATVHHLFSRTVRHGTN